MNDLSAYCGWLTLHLLPEIGRTRFHRLLERFGSPEAILAASPAEWRATDGVGPMSVDALASWRQLVDVDAELHRIEEGGAWLLCLADPEYPDNLRRMPCPPPLIYGRGTLEPIDEAAVAVVGTRKMSRYGREATDRIAGDLARAGVTVVSGLALGIDSAAHRAALEAGGRTIAVLGNGLSHVYPAQHRQLAADVIEHGALISDMPMDATPDAGSFPQRNGLIAGLSLGVLVVEAAAKSGTQITVERALEANRAVYAVPGDITRVNSVGANRLIQEGARLVTDARDILLDLQPQLAHLLSGLPSLSDPEEGAAPAPLPKDLSAVEERVYLSLELDPLPIDDLDLALADPPVSPSELMTALLNLELRGLVRQEPGKRFRRLR